MIELVWDTDRYGTATAPSGSSATIGESADFDPEDLLAMAAAGCLMRTFLRLSAERGAPVLSYVATAHADASDGAGTPRLALRSFVVVQDHTERRDVMRLLDDAWAASPVCRMLGDRATHSAEIQCLRGVRARSA